MVRTHLSHCPLTVLYIPALLPMIPGMYAYKSVYALVKLAQNLGDYTMSDIYINQFFVNATVTVSVVFLLAGEDHAGDFPLPEKGLLHDAPENMDFTEAGIAFTEVTEGTVRPCSRGTAWCPCCMVYLRLLITVNLRLVRALGTHADVGGLFGRKTREVYAELFEMEAGHLFVSAWADSEHPARDSPPGPKFHLGERLVGKRIAHHE